MRQINGDSLRNGKYSAMAKRDLAGRQRAEALAVQALGYIAGEPEQLGRFLALSGLGPDTIRNASHDPQFLAGVLDYLIGDERLLSAFASHAAVTPQQVMQAHGVLSGGVWERDTP
jgi:Protein of unknown function (DUF3572)